MSEDGIERRRQRGMLKDQRTSYDEEYPGGTDKRFGRFLKAAEENGIELNTDTKILDVGSGNSAFVKKLEEVGLHPVGIDYRPHDIGKHQVIGEAERLPFADGSFDILCSSYAFDNLIYNQDQSSMVREIERVLRPGGIYIASEPFTDVKPAKLKLVFEDPVESVYKKIN